MTAVSCSDILALWWRVHRERPSMGVVEYEATRIELGRMGRNVHGRARSLLADLSTKLGHETEAEAWWALLCGWPHGYPPDPSLTPAADTGVVFDPMTGERL